MMKGKDGECCCKHKMHHGICMIILAVLVLLNGMYTWLSWYKFAAIILGVLGLKMVMMGCCKCKKK